MNVSGTDAAGYDAISLSSFEAVNKGTLLEADDTTGVVRFQPKVGDPVTVTLGAHSIRIIPRSSYGRGV